MNGALRDAVVSWAETELGLDLHRATRASALRSAGRVLTAAGIGSVGAFTAGLARDASFREDLVAAVMVGETSFFREGRQLELLRQEILPQLVARRPPGQVLRFWSAGCATGEEAYTLAIVADEEGLGTRARVLGTDVNAAALRHAERGVYGVRSVRGEAASRRVAPFFADDGGRLRVHDRLRGRVRFGMLNLVDGPPQARFDVVFCRNVLIYLGPSAVARAGRTLRDALLPDGWLVTASSDPPLDVEGLTMVSTPAGFAYRLASAVQARAERRVETGLVLSHRASAVVSSDRPTAAPGREATHVPVPSPEGPEPAEDPSLAVGRIRALVDSGRGDEAMSALQDALAAHPLEAAVHLTAAVVHADAGRLGEAVRAVSTASYLDPTLIAAHMLRGQLERTVGNPTGASRAFRAAAALLRALPADGSVPFFDGEPASRLAGLAEQLAGAGVARGQR